MKIILIILSFFVIFSFPAKLLTIDVQLDKNKKYIIKNIDDNVDIFFDKNLFMNIIPQKYMYLIKLIFVNNKIMNNCLNTKYKGYDTFYCKENKENKYINNNLEKIKLNFNFDNYTYSYKISDIFSKKTPGNLSFFNFYSKPNITKIILGNKKNINQANNNLRILEEFKEINDTNINNDTTNQTEKRENYSSKSGIGWLGICLIILLSLIVTYVIYVGFRYYRRKKYQNPSFYYKITEEMFDDITPIE